MAADTRRTQGRAVAVLTLVALLVMLWIHSEVITIHLVGASRKYLKSGSSMNAGSVTKDPAPSSASMTVAPTNASNVSMITNDTLVEPSNHTNTTTLMNATIVVYLSGEMGNHLGIIAKAFAVKNMARQTYDIDANLVFRHQSHPKWVRGRDDIQQCFPNLREYNFSQANTREFDALCNVQSEVLQANDLDPTRLVLDGNDDDTYKSLAYWKSILESDVFVGVDSSSSSVKLPFLTVARFCSDNLLDRHYDEIRSFLEFDKVNCCRIRPDPDESVFHLRNFLVEMPRRGKRKGFEELSPNKTASELFAHLQRGEKVAITTRFGGEHVAPYVSALEQRGIDVRVISNQTGVQDFCFLLQSQKELLGTTMSTFAAWAAYLGDTKRVILYQVKGPNTRQGMPSSFNWTHPHLKDRVYLEVFKSEEQDELEANEQEGRMLLIHEWSLL